MRRSESRLDVVGPWYVGERSSGSDRGYRYRREERKIEREIDLLID